MTSAGLRNLMMLCGICLAASLSAHATSTKSFVLDDAAALEAGELDGTAVESSGAVTVGVSSERVVLENVPVALSMVVDGDTIYAGTGVDGAIYRVRKGKAELFAKTDELAISALAIGWSGSLFAGSMPKGKILRVGQDGKVGQFVDLPETEHVWALVYDRAGDRLIAGTGPNGKIFSVNKKGTIKELYDGEASHVLSLALDGKGGFFAGTSDGALLLNIDKKGDSHVVRDFDATEITALAHSENGLGVAVNTFVGERGSKAKAPPTKSKAPPKPGKGELWFLSPDGRAQELFAKDDTHFPSVGWSAGAILVGTARDGRVYRVERNGDHAMVADVEERQILSLASQHDRPVFATGDGASIYAVKSGKPAKPIWTSKVLDAKFDSRWGQLNWRGRGAIRLQTRSGNTADPDDSWSDWSEPLKSPGAVRSPAARFVQVRAQLPSDRSVILYAIELYYLPRNQGVRIHDIKFQSQGAPSSRYDINWKTDNPDGDALRYRLAFREESQSRWREILHEDRILTETEYTWHTASLPDGHYIVRVEASDEYSNPATRAIRNSAQSEPVLIDNHPPTVRKLKYKGRTLTGRVLDAMGPIASIQYAVDGDHWQHVFPKDLLLDEADEAFDIDLKGLAEGDHIIAVRAKDAAGNIASAEITVRIK